MRGTNKYGGTALSTVSGSPPLARDKFLATKTNKIPFGITPACAGQMKYMGRFAEITQDHPRLRGTNTYSMPMNCLEVGSPPLARDK